MPVKKKIFKKKIGVGEHKILKKKSEVSEINTRVKRSDKNKT